MGLGGVMVEESICQTVVWGREYKVSACILILLDLPWDTEMTGTQWSEGVTCCLLSIREGVSSQSQWAVSFHYPNSSSDGSTKASA